MFDVLDAKVALKEWWTLLEVFVGRARLSDLAQRRGQCWCALPPQDMLYNLDLLQEGEMQLRPDVITLAPPRGPWSAQQRMRKCKHILRELRRHHLPFWEFVCWCWDFQNSTGGLVVLEQPSSLEALRLPIIVNKFIKRWCIFANWASGIGYPGSHTRSRRSTNESSSSGDCDVPGQGL